MIVTYARSSSLKEWEYCQQKFFINYNLGIKEPSSKKAVMGTITHKVLEWLALCKQNDNNSDIIKFFDDSLEEELSIDKQKLYDRTVLDDNTIKEINKTRSNKSIYKSTAYLSTGAERLGYHVVNDMVLKSFNYYTKKYPYDWTLSDLKNCGNWTWMALEWKDGHYDPRNRTILSPEQSFDITIDKEWANYDYRLGNEHFFGNFAIKGTVDLITSVNSDTIEIVDWKTGQRYDWAKGEEKTYNNLCSDIQLSLYHYAISKLYPAYKHVMLTIFYIRDGGPFTITFEPENSENVEQKLKEHLEEVKATRLPKMLSPQQSDFRCTKLCSYYKTKWPNSDQNVCRFIHNEIKRIGMDEVIDKYKQKQHDFSKYDQPGE